MDYQPWYRTSLAQETLYKLSKTVAQHSAVQPPSGKEIGMGAVLDDLTFLHYKNPIAVYGGFEPMRDQDDSSQAA